MFTLVCEPPQYFDLFLLSFWFLVLIKSWKKADLQQNKNYLMPRIFSCCRKSIILLNFVFVSSLKKISSLLDCVSLQLFSVPPLPCGPIITIRKQTAAAAFRVHTIFLLVDSQIFAPVRLCPLGPQLSTRSQQHETPSKTAKAFATSGAQLLGINQQTVESWLMLLPNSTSSSISIEANWQIQ